MEAAEILERARSSEEPPPDWIVLPLQKRKVQIGMLGWAAGVLVGVGLFAFIAASTIPYNYQSGFYLGCFATVLLGICMFIGAGSLWAIITDVRRLRNAEKYVIVITPSEFVQQEGDRIVQVPLMYVRHVTARGAPPPERPEPGKQTLHDIPGAGEHVAGLLFGRGMTPRGFRQRRKRMHTPTTLAFLDAREDREIIVATDNSYGDTFLIAAHLKQYAASVQRVV